MDIWLPSFKKAEQLAASVRQMVRSHMCDTPPLDAFNCDPLDIEVEFTEKPVSKAAVAIKKRPAIEISSDDEEPAPAAHQEFEEHDAKDQKQYRHWAGTWPSEGPSPVDVYGGEVELNVCVAQKEVGEGGFKHWQWCVSFKKPKRFNEVKTAALQYCYENDLDVKTIKPIWLCSFNEAVEGRRGKEGLAAMRNYCKMDDKKGQVDKASRVVFGLKELAGKVSKKGKRTDLTDFLKAAKERKGLWDVLDEEIEERDRNVLCKYPRHAAEVNTRLMMEQPKALKTVMCFWGATGTGKSTRARKYLAKRGWSVASGDVFIKGPNDCWWDSYNPAKHKAVIVNEFGKAGQDPKVHTMWLQITDKDEELFVVPNKGGFTVINPEVVIFTSTAHPNAWIQSWDHHDNGEQYARRMQQCVECKKVYQPPPVVVSDDNDFRELMEEMPAE